MKKKTKIILFSGIAILLIAAAAIAYVFRPAPDSVKRLKPDYKVSAEILVTAFEDDEASAESKYKNKIIQVTGVVSNVTRANEGNSLVFLTGGMMGEVSCQFVNAELDRSKAAIGKKITAKGKYSGYTFDVVLNKCCLIED